MVLSKPGVPSSETDETNDNPEADPYVRLAAAVFLQAVSDYLTYLRARQAGRHLWPSEYETAASAIAFLRGLPTTGISLSHCRSALGLDIEHMYHCPHQHVVVMTAALRRGRRRLSDY